MDEEKCIARNSPPHILEREKKLAHVKESFFDALEDKR